MTKRHLALVVGGVIAVVIVSLCLIYSSKPSRPITIPKTILTEINFPVFYPNDTKYIQQNSFKYDKVNKYVNFIVKFNHSYLTFSEQATPETFALDSSAYSQMVSRFNRYSSFESLYGTVNLAKPTSSKEEIAIMNAKGTLLFARTDNGLLSENSWKLLFNTLKYDLPL